jgi:hypothetical protein
MLDVGVTLIIIGVLMALDAPPSALVGIGAGLIVAELLTKK